MNAHSPQGVHHDRAAETSVASPGEQRFRNLELSREKQKSPRSAAQPPQFTANVRSSPRMALASTHTRHRVRTCMMWTPQNPPLDPRWNGASSGPRLASDVRTVSTEHPMKSSPLPRCHSLLRPRGAAVRGHGGPLSHGQSAGHCRWFTSSKFHKTSCLPPELSSSVKRAAWPANAYTECVHEQVHEIIKMIPERC